MKVYNLGCSHGHRFEGWFSSEQDFNAQSAAGRVICPVCDNAEVARLPSAPRLRKCGDPENQVPAGADVQKQVFDLMRQMVARSEDVGARFAEEARRMHYEETAARPIRGVASQEECAALSEEGIGVLPIPDMLKEPLQ